MGVSKGARTRTEFKEDIQESNQSRVNAVMESMKARKEALNGTPKTSGDTSTDITGPINGG
jgi:hypothetical protein